VTLTLNQYTGAPVFGFYSTHANADHFGFERATDFALAYGQTYGYEIAP